MTSVFSAGAFASIDDNTLYDVRFGKSALNVFLFVRTCTNSIAPTRIVTSIDSARKPYVTALSSISTPTI